MSIDPRQILDDIKGNLAKGDLKPDIDDFYAEVGRDPAKMLWAFLRMRNSPRRREIGFQRAELGWMSQAWMEAATATPRGRERDEMVRQSEFYAGLRKRLETEELTHREEGVLFLEDADWPHPQVIIKAIESLCLAGVKTLLQ